MSKTLAEKAGNKIQMVQPIMMTVMRVITVTIIVLQELLPTKGLSYLCHIHLVMHQEEEVMLRKLILDPALAVSVAVDDLKRNQTFWNANFVYLALIYVMKVPNSSEKKS